MNVKKYKEMLDKLQSKSRKGSGESKPYMVLEQGDNVVRILPGHPTMDSFFREIYKHNRSGKNGYSVPCANEGKESGNCPICQVLYPLKNSSIKAKKDQYYSERAKPRFLMQVIDRADEKHKLMAVGVTIIKQILDYVVDTDNGDITDPFAGVDVVIARSGEMLDTEYRVRLKRQNTPIFSSKKAIKELIGASAEDTKLFDLTKESAPLDTPEKTMLVWEKGWSALKELEEDEDEEETPKPAKAKLVKKAPWEEDEEDEEEEIDDEDAEEEEEEEEVKPKTKKTEKKPKKVVEEDEEEDELESLEKTLNSVKKSKKK